MAAFINQLSDKRISRAHSHENIQMAIRAFGKGLWVWGRLLSTSPIATYRLWRWPSLGTDESPFNAQSSGASEIPTGCVFSQHASPSDWDCLLYDGTPASSNFSFFDIRPEYLFATDLEVELFSNFPELWGCETNCS